jgi:hypothetical protein
LNVEDAVYNGMTSQEFDRVNAEWLNAAVQRGDNIMSVTDPVVHAQRIEIWRANDPEVSSRYLDLEIPFLKELNVNPIPAYPTSSGALPSR